MHISEMHLPNLIVQMNDHEGKNVDADDFLSFASDDSEAGEIHSTLAIIMYSDDWRIPTTHTQSPLQRTLVCESVCFRGS